MWFIPAYLRLLNKTQDLYHTSYYFSSEEQEIRNLEDELHLLEAILGEVKVSERLHLERKETKQLDEFVYKAEDTIEECLAELGALRASKNAIPSEFQMLRSLSRTKKMKDLRETKVSPLLKEGISALPFSVVSDALRTLVERPRTILRKVESTSGTKKLNVTFGQASHVMKPHYRHYENELVCHDIGLLQQTRRYYEYDEIAFAGVFWDRFTGFKDQEETIAGYLMEKKEELDVISIIGMPGQGKTTLAYNIFQKEEIALEFPTRIWIHVSQNFEKRKMHLNILKLFTSQDMSILTDQEVAESVRACLVKEKFLLILDDVWSTASWIDIKDVLPLSNGMAKVVITSDNKDVGARANIKRNPHIMRFITLEETWELLQLEVFGNLVDCSPGIEEIGKLMAYTCDRRPLHLAVLQGALRFIGLNQKKWWEVSRELLRDNSFSHVLELSYNGLPNDLRECFLYMGVFPKDYEISAWTLIRLWIAEGFIQPKDGESLEETAFQYLDTLIGMNLVMIDKTNLIGKVKTCRVHEMIRAFCIWKAQLHNLYQNIERSDMGVLEPSVPKLRLRHRVCVHSVPTLLSYYEVSNIFRVRSFLCFDGLAKGSDPSCIAPSLFGNSKLVKVLETKAIKFHEIPLEITNLLHLKYLALFVDDLDVLPKALSKLWNLQTLVVETKSRLVAMEANIWRMIRLRHFSTNAAIVLLSKGKRVAGAGENLQTMKTLSPESCTKAFFKMARNLKTLGIRGNLATLSANMSLEKNHQLEKLKLLNDSLEEKESKNVLLGVPLHSHFPPYLKRLTLSNTFLKWKHMSILSKISTLEVIKLKDNAFNGIYWNATNDRFVGLQSLLIANTNLVQWEASVDSLPSLRRLVLKNCVNLNEIPVELAKTLEKLDIEHLGKSAVQSAMRISELKKQAREKRKSKSLSGFKLSIGPGCSC